MAGILGNLICMALCCLTPLRKVAHRTYGFISFHWTQRKLKERERRDTSRWGVKETPKIACCPVLNAFGVLAHAIRVCPVVAFGEQGYGASLVSLADT